MAAQATPRIRHIATHLCRDDIVVLAEFEKTVHLSSIEPPQVLNTLETVLDGGGERVALCETDARSVVVAAAWARHGICGYDAATGELLWQRTDLKQPQALSPTGDGSLVAAGLSMGAMRVLDAATGADVARVRKADVLWQSRHGAIAAVGWYQRLALISTKSWRPLWAAPIEGFAVLDVAFAKDGLVAGDTAEGWVYAFDLAGRELWRNRLGARLLPWAVAWDSSADEWLAVGVDPGASGRSALVRLTRDGQPIATTPIERPIAVAMLPGGRHLVTERYVIDTRTLRTIEHPLA